MKQKLWLLAMILAAGMVLANPTNAVSALNPVYIQKDCPTGSPNEKWWTVTDYDENGNVTCVIGRNCFGEIYCRYGIASSRGNRANYIISQIPKGTYPVYSAGTGNVLWTVIEYDANKIEACRVTKYTDGTITTTCSESESSIQTPSNPNDQSGQSQEKGYDFSDNSPQHNNLIGVVNPITPSNIVGITQSSTPNVVGKVQE
ncbi:MAG: hypothetical protein DYG96_15625 [Chlorobi bacterium CHB2]|nr:hypothetical protein [Chlorobi bacterium CHB2]